MATEYKLLKENKEYEDADNTTVQIKSDQHEENKDEIKYDKSKKHSLWLSTILYLKSIEIEKQEFGIKGRFHLFWNDKYLLQQLKNDGHNSVQILKCCDLSIQIKNMLPLNINYCHFFENSKQITFTTEPTIEYTSNGTFLMTVEMECIFYQYFKLNHYYPQDVHSLNIQLLYNQEQYQWNHNKMAPQLIYEFDEHFCNLYNWHQRVSFSLADFVNIREWKSIKPMLICRDSHNFCLISFKISRSYSDVSCSIIFPLFLMISATFSIYSIHYGDFISRLNLIFLSFIFTAIIHFKSPFYLRTYLFCAYIILILMTIESVLFGNVFKMDSKTMDGLEIGLSITFSLIWLLSTCFHCGICRNKENDWRKYDDTQWENLRKLKFMHLSNTVSYHHAKDGFTTVATLPAL